MNPRPARAAAVTAGFTLTLLLAGCSTNTLETVTGTGAVAPVTPAGSTYRPAAAVDATPSAWFQAMEPTQPAGNTTAVPAAGRIPPGSVDSTSPNAVAIAVVTTINRHDTAADASPQDALRRARAWLTPTLLADSLDVPQRGDAQWTTLAAHHGYTVVDHVELVNETGQPSNTATTTYVQLSYQTRQINRGSPEVSVAAAPQLIRLELARGRDGTWKVNAFLQSN